jgi:hypothetical protein
MDDEEKSFEQFHLAQCQFNELLGKKIKAVVSNKVKIFQKALMEVHLEVYEHD